MTNAIPSSHRGPIVSRPWKGGLNGTVSRPGGRRSSRQGPIHGLVSAAVAAAQQQPAQQSGQGGVSACIDDASVLSC